MIDLLSRALTTTTPYAEETTQIPPTNQNLPVSPSGVDPYASHSYPSDPRHPQVPLQQDYVAPWADPHQQQSFIQQQHQQGTFSQQPQQQQPFMQPLQPQPYLELHQQQPFRQQPPQYPSNSYGYPPPPWATSNFQNPPVTDDEVNKQPPQTFNSFSSSMGSSSGPHLSTASVNGVASSTGSKAYIPPYKLFEDLNVLGSRDSGSSNTSSSTSLSGQSRVGG